MLASTAVTDQVTLHGYFDHEHIGDMAREAARMKARGIYFIPNPVSPDLLPCAPNRVEKAKKGSSTTDAQVLAYLWLLVDCVTLFGRRTRRPRILSTKRPSQRHKRSCPNSVWTVGRTPSSPIAATAVICCIGFTFPWRRRGW